MTVRNSAVAAFVRMRVFLGPTRILTNAATPEARTALDSRRHTKSHEAREHRKHSAAIAGPSRRPICFSLLLFVFLRVSSWIGIMDKNEVAAVLEECGTLLELQGENAFRCNAYH